VSIAEFYVRAASDADIAEVIAMERTIAEAPHWAEAEYAAIINPDKNVGGTIKRCAIKRCLFVAEAESRLLGFAVGKVLDSGDERMAELESVAVEKAARRGGVGRALCGAVIAWSRSQGAAALELEVRAGSEGAIALYAGQGFVVVGRRRGYYREPPEDAVMMRLHLELQSEKDR
jgi:[ribosomal protein S18]-alanine N-acetyltransferase